MTKPAPQRSPVYNTFLRALIAAYEEKGVTRFIMTRFQLEHMFMAYTGHTMTKDHVQIVRASLLGKGYKISVGLDVAITKLQVVEVPKAQWPMLLDALVRRMKYHASLSNTNPMMFTHKKFQDFATIWPTSEEFRSQAVEALKNVGLNVRFLSSSVRVTREPVKCSA